MTSSLDAPGRAMDRDARNRMERLLFSSIGVGALLYSAVLFPGASGFGAETPQLAPWYGYGLIAVSIGLPILLGVTTWFLPPAVQRGLAIGTALMFVVAMMLFPVGLLAPTLEGNVSPWYQGVHAVHATLLATATQRKWLYLYGLSHGIVIGVVQVAVREDAVKSAVLDAVGSTIFAIILMAIAAGVMRAAGELDRSSAAVRAQAAQVAAVRAREREESRINALVHDDIMSVLITASRENPPATLARQAGYALESIERLGDADTQARDYSPKELVGALAEVVERIDPTASTSFTIRTDAATPATVVSAMSDALGEALRNSMRHADSGKKEVTRIVSGEVAANEVAVSVKDDGKGFSVRKATSRRLGLRLSIIERMALVEGGGAAISSRPGSGTTVNLTWRRA